MRLVARCGLILCAIAALGATAPAQDYPSRPVTWSRPMRRAAAPTWWHGCWRRSSAASSANPSWWRTAWARAGSSPPRRSPSRARRPHAIHGTSTQLAIQVTLHKKLPYDPATDFAPIALVASVPFVLLVHPALPVNSVADLIRLAKEKPGTLTFGSSGVGGPPHLYTELLKTMTGMQLTHVPYKGTAQAINDVGRPRAAHLLRHRAGGAADQGGTLASARHLVGDPLRQPPRRAADRRGRRARFQRGRPLMVVAPTGTPKPIVDKLHGALKSIAAAPTCSAGSSTSAIFR